MKLLLFLSDRGERDNVMPAEAYLKMVCDINKKLTVIVESAQPGVIIPVKQVGTDDGG